jgi:hypothetical protein
MSIDMKTEKLVTFAEGAKLFPPRRQGRPVHPITLWRWARVGHHGIKLEAARLPSGWVTSVEALRRFVERLTDDLTSTQAPAPQRKRRTQHRVSRRLDSEGF